jgi:muconolactone delta-isomerase
MEFLVTMTTRVPHGTAPPVVDAVRAREGARASQLAVQGHLLRLWRPPLQPGEWRTIGLFAAQDGARLEEVLASMPLRIWRRDDVTELAPHPNDPPSPTPRRRGAREFLTTLTLAVPDTVGAAAVRDATAAEARRARELAVEGALVRLWRLPGDGRALGLWQADDADQLEAVLASLPLRPWLGVEAIPLDEHPNDPALREVDTGVSPGSVDART